MFFLSIWYSCIIQMCVTFQWNRFQRNNRILLRTTKPIASSLVVSHQSRAYTTRQPLPLWIQQQKQQHWSMRQRLFRLYGVVKRTVQHDTSKNNRFNDGMVSPPYDSQYRNFLSIQQCIDLFHQSQNSTLLSATMKNKNVRFIDGTWDHKKLINGKMNFLYGPRIPNSVYFDMDDIATTTKLYPTINPNNLSHIQPTMELYTAYMDAVHIHHTDILILYSTSIQCAFLSRIWFTMKYIMGHEHVYIMYGSIYDWINANGPVDDIHLELSSVPTAKDIIRNVSTFQQSRQSLGQGYQVQKYNDELLISQHDMECIVYNMLNDTRYTNYESNKENQQNYILVDTRGSSFITDGHIPNAKNVPYSIFHHPQLPLYFHNVSTLQTTLQQYGLYAHTGSTSNTYNESTAIFMNDMSNDNGPTNSSPGRTSQKEKPKTTIVLSCGSGVSVCNLILAFDECYRKNIISQSDHDDDYVPYNILVYDGSWEEWSTISNVPKILGR